MAVRFAFVSADTKAIPADSNAIQRILGYPIPAKYTGFPGIIPGFSVSSRYPGISAKYTGLSRVSTSPPYGGREVQCRRRPTVGPTSLRRRSDVASDVAPTSSGRRRSDVAPTSGRRRSTSLRHRSIEQRICITYIRVRA